jgi:hypothetical protein
MKINKIIKVMKKIKTMKMIWIETMIIIIEAIETVIKKRMNILIIMINIIIKIKRIEINNMILKTINQIKFILKILINLIKIIK